VTWLLLVVGVGLEVAGTLCMKMADGFRSPGAALLMYLLYGLSLTTLTFAFQRLQIGFAYAAWSGGGLVLVAASGMIWFREPASAQRLLFIALVLLGLLGLHLTSPARS